MEIDQEYFIKMIVPHVNLFDRGWKINRFDPEIGERIFCNRKNFKPYEDFNQLAYCFRQLGVSSMQTDIDKAFKALLDICVKREL